MASGSSSGRVNLGSKGYDLGNEDILSSYSNLDSLNENYSDHGTISAKDFQKSRMAQSSAFPAPSYSPPEEYVNQDLATTVERTMKKYADNLMRFLEGISSRLSQLELYCYNLDKSVGEMRTELARDNGEADSKLKFIEKHLQEVHRSVQILRDKQELAETQKELSKIQLAQESNSSVHSQQSEERASPPISDPRKIDSASDMHGQQLALALPNQVSSQPLLPTRQVEQRHPHISQQPTMPPQGVMLSQGYYLQQVQLSNMPSQMQQTQGQYLPSESQYRTPPQPTHPQVNQTPQNHSLSQYQQQWSQQPSQQGQSEQQTSLQPHIRPSSPATYSPYMPGQAGNPSTPETLPNSMPMKMSYSGISQPITSHAESMSYGYVGVSRPVQQQPSHQHLKTTFGTQPGDGYVTSGPHPTQSPGNAYMMYNVESGTPVQLPQSHIQQSSYPQNQQPPTATNLMVRPPQIMRNHPYSELFEKLGSMGFRGDQVASVIQRMEESGQLVDFNAVLDRLNAQSSAGSQRPWSG
ncbi:Formin-like protein 7 [Heracleum sosnowskyi]|uniref:Formin-like protein 7 n=1 Tax=Heracleum sosnowskyi TaxID=360622 RepID=A0AAD8ING0_9APIA|nr:Formin-like protein 7 [Heracleum sosnowskyi]